MFSELHLVPMFESMSELYLVPMFELMIEWTVVGPYIWVSEWAVLGPYVWVNEWTVLGPYVWVSEWAVLGPYVWVNEWTVLGPYVWVNDWVNCTWSLWLSQWLSELYLVPMIESMNELYLVPMFESMNELYLAPMFESMSELYLAPMFESVSELYLAPMFESVSELYLVPMFESMSELYLVPMFESMIEWTVVGPYVWVSEWAVLGPYVWVNEWTVLGPYVWVSEWAVLGPYVWVNEWTVLGPYVWVNDWVNCTWSLWLSQWLSELYLVPMFESMNELYLAPMFESMNELYLAPMFESMNELYLAPMFESVSELYLCRCLSRWRDTSSQRMSCTCAGVWVGGETPAVREWAVLVQVFESVERHQQSANELYLCRCLSRWRDTSSQRMSCTCAGVWVGGETPAVREWAVLVQVFESVERHQQSENELYLCRCLSRWRDTSSQRMSCTCAGVWVGGETPAVREWAVLVQVFESVERHQQSENELYLCRCLSRWRDTSSQRMSCTCAGVWVGGETPAVREWAVLVQVFESVERHQQSENELYLCRCLSRWRDTSSQRMSCTCAGVWVGGETPAVREWAVLVQVFESVERHQQSENELYLCRCLSRWRDTSSQRMSCTCAGVWVGGETPAVREWAVLVQVFESVERHQQSENELYLCRCLSRWRDTSSQRMSCTCAGVWVGGETPAVREWAVLVQVFESVERHQQSENELYLCRCLSRWRDTSSQRMSCTCAGVWVGGETPAVREWAVLVQVFESVERHQQSENELYLCRCLSRWRDTSSQRMSCTCAGVWVGGETPAVREWAVLVQVFESVERHQQSENELYLCRCLSRWRDTSSQRMSCTCAGVWVGGETPAVREWAVLVQVFESVERHQQSENELYLCRCLSRWRDTSSQRMSCTCAGVWVGGETPAVREWAVLVQVFESVERHQQSENELYLCRCLSRWRDTSSQRMSCTCAGVWVGGETPAVREWAVLVQVFESVERHQQSENELYLCRCLSRWRDTSSQRMSCTCAGVWVGGETPAVREWAVLVQVFESVERHQQSENELYLCRCLSRWRDTSSQRMSCTCAGVWVGGETPAVREWAVLVQVFESVERHQQSENELYLCRCLSRWRDTSSQRMSCTCAGVWVGGETPAVREWAVLVQVFESVERHQQSENELYLCRCLSRWRDTSSQRMSCTCAGVWVGGETPAVREWAVLVQVFESVERHQQSENELYLCRCLSRWRDTSSQRMSCTCAGVWVGGETPAVREWAVLVQVFESVERHQQSENELYLCRCLSRWRDTSSQRMSCTCAGVWVGGETPAVREWAVLVQVFESVERHQQSENELYLCRCLSRWRDTSSQRMSCTCAGVWVGGETPAVREWAVLVQVFESVERHQQSENELYLCRCLSRWRDTSSQRMSCTCAGVWVGGETPAVREWAVLVQVFESVERHQQSENELYLCRCLSRWRDTSSQRMSCTCAGVWVGGETPAVREWAVLVQVFESVERHQQSENELYLCRCLSRWRDTSSQRMSCTCAGVWVGGETPAVREWAVLVQVFESVERHQQSENELYLCRCLSRWRDTSSQRMSCTCAGVWVGGETPAVREWAVLVQVFESVERHQQSENELYLCRCLSRWRDTSSQRMSCTCAGVWVGGETPAVREWAVLVQVFESVERHQQSENELYLCRCLSRWRDTSSQRMSCTCAGVWVGGETPAVREWAVLVQVFESVERHQQSENELYLCRCLSRWRDTSSQRMSCTCAGVWVGGETPAVREWAVLVQVFESVERHQQSENELYLCRCLSRWRDTSSQRMSCTCAGVWVGGETPAVREWAVLVQVFESVERHQQSENELYLCRCLSRWRDTSSQRMSCTCAGVWVGGETPAVREWAVLVQVFESVERHQQSENELYLCRCLSRWRDTSSQRMSCTCAGVWVGGETPAVREWAVLVQVFESVERHQQSENELYLCRCLCRWRDTSSQRMSCTCAGVWVGGETPAVREWAVLVQVFESVERHQQSENELYLCRCLSRWRDNSSQRMSCTCAGVWVGGETPAVREWAVLVQVFESVERHQQSENELYLCRCLSRWRDNSSQRMSCTCAGVWVGGETPAVREWAVLVQVFESVERHQQSEYELQERVRQLSEELSRQQQLLTETEQQYLQQLDTERTQAQVSAAVRQSLETVHINVDSSEMQITCVSIRTTSVDTEYDFFKIIVEESACFVCTECLQVHSSVYTNILVSGSQCSTVVVL